MKLAIDASAEQSIVLGLRRNSKNLIFLVAVEEYGLCRALL